MPKVQKVLFPGPAGQLEGLLKYEEKREPKALAVVCHPHPLYHGTMHNKVVFAVADTYFRLGCSVLRFNFRGVGLSFGVHDNGKGEVEDARAAIGYLRRRFHISACHIAGFSFGARIAMESAVHDPTLSSLCVVAPSFKNSDFALPPQWSIPKLFLQGTADSICAAEELRLRFPSFPTPKMVVWIEEADHFFVGRLEKLKEAICLHREFLNL
jgi:uncharacterized protein